MNQEAIEYAKQQAEMIKKQQQYQLDQAQLAEAERIKALELAKQQQLGQITLQKQKEEESAKSLQQQEYLSKMLNQKSLNENLIRNGLGQTGARESTLSDLYANYGTNINKINTDKLSALRDLSQSENDAQLSYGQNLSTVLSEEAIRKAQIQSSIDDNAINQYNNAYSQYVAQKQYEESLKQQAYENEQSKLAQQEAIRQWQIENDQKLQAQQEAIRQWEAEYNLSKKSVNSTVKSSSSSNNNSQNQFTETTDNNYGNSNETINLSDYKFTSAKGTQYQPKYINNNKLTQATNNNKKLTANDIFSNFKYGDRKIWTEGGKYYVWYGPASEKGSYADITDYVTSSLKNNKKVTL